MWFKDGKVILIPERLRQKYENDWKSYSCYVLSEFWILLAEKESS